MFFFFRQFHPIKLFSIRYDVMKKQKANFVLNYKKNMLQSWLQSSVTIVVIPRSAPDEIPHKMKLCMIMNYVSAPGDGTAEAVIPFTPDKFETKGESNYPIHLYIDCQWCVSTLKNHLE